MSSKHAYSDCRVLMIDNYDSFTYNLVQAFAAQGAQMLVYRNDALSVADALALEPTHLVISPGPGRPEGAGESLAMIGAFEKRIPIFGVCLGHQSIVQHFGGRIIREKRLMHGKTSDIKHDGLQLYQGLDNPLQVGRYHSLAAELESLPACLGITSTTDQDEIMGVRHKQLLIEGVQFHPESVLTPQGDALMANFLGQAYA